MDTDYLREYATLAECESFTEAAGRLHITQSTLSKHVAAMERAFGCDLFVRDKHGARMTPAGQAVLVRVREALSSLDAARREARRAQGATGPVLACAGAEPDAHLKRACRVAGERFGLDMQEMGALALYLSGASVEAVGRELGLSRDGAASVLGAAYRALGVRGSEEALARIYSDSE